MRVLVTGATGFVGGRAVRWLAQRGYTVIASGRRPAESLRAPLPNYLAWDLARGPLPLPPIDAIVHCAAHVGDSGNDPAYEAANVRGLRNLLASVPSSARFVHISSGSVYDLLAPTAQLKEDARYAQHYLSAYARTKAEAERIVLALSPVAVILRPHAIYGPGDTHILPGLLAARRLGWLPAFGDGKNRFSVTHVDNLAIAIALALRSEAPPGIYNIADAEDATVDEILRTLLRRSSHTARVAYVPRWAALPAASVGDVVRDALRLRGDRAISRFLVRHMSQEFTLDTTRARQRLGYAARWDFRSGPLTEEGA